MTSPLDPPLVRERARIRSVRSWGTVQIVFSAGFLVAAIVSATNGMAAATVASLAGAAVALFFAGGLARSIAARRLTAFEAAHGVGAGLARPPQRREGTADVEAETGPHAAAAVDADAPDPTPAPHRPPPTPPDSESGVGS